MSIRSKIVRDAFTERLLEVWIELVKLDAISYKKDFTAALNLTLSEFYQVENHLRNYPLDESKRSLAILGLQEKYFVNPGYMRGSSTTKFFREPEKAKRIAGSGKVTNVASARKLKEYKAEIENYKARVAELEAALEIKKTEGILPEIPRQPMKRLAQGELAQIPNKLDLIRKSSERKFAELMEFKAELDADPEKKARFMAIKKEMDRQARAKYMEEKKLAQQNDPATDPPKKKKTPKPKK